jgi:hypothetical protein
MMALLVDPLLISVENFAAVSGTLSDQDSTIVRTCQSATRPQPATLRDRLSPPGPAARLHMADSQWSSSLAANTPDSDPLTLTKRQPNPVKTKLRPSPSAGALIPYRRDSKRNSPFGAHSWEMRSTPFYATRTET